MHVCFGRLSWCSSLSVADTDPENHGVWGGQESAAQPTNRRPCQAGRRPRVGGGGGSGGGGREGGETTTLILLKPRHLGHTRGPPNFTLFYSMAPLQRNRNTGKQLIWAWKTKTKRAPAKKNSFQRLLQYIFFSAMPSKEFASKVTVFFYFYFFFPQATGQRLHFQTLQNKTHSSTLPQIQSSSVISSLLIKEGCWWRLVGWWRGLSRPPPPHPQPHHPNPLTHPPPPPPPYTLLPWFPWRLLSPKLR